MAEGQGNHQQDTKIILQQCAQNLFNAVQLLNNCNTESPDTSVSSNNRSSVSSEINTSSNNRSSVSTSCTTSSTSLRLSVQDEHRRLFGYRPPTPRSSYVQSQQGRQQGSGKKRVVTGRNGKPKAITIKDTWTHSFVCLGNTCDDMTPNCKQKVDLSMAGLGEKKVTFEKNGRWPHINEKVTEAFPKLKDGGGYELLRTEDKRRHLVVMPCPPGGYTVTYLKGVLSQAKAYIRPIQKNLSLNVELDYSEDIEIVKCDCVNCGQSIPISEMRVHMVDCGGGSSTASAATLSLNNARENLSMVSGNSDDESDTDLGTPALPSHDIRKYMCDQPTSITATAAEVVEQAPISSADDENTSTLPQIYPVVSKSSSSNEVEMLLEMFPDLSHKVIEDALIASKNDVAVTINCLLAGNKAEAVDESTPLEEDEDDDLDIPLVCTNLLRERNELESLHDFISGTINPFGPELNLSIDRNQDILPQAMRKYKHSNFDVSKVLNVSFLDEPGLDAGGLTREYFHLLTNRLQNPVGSFNLFEGTCGHLVPNHNYDFLSGGLFILVGKMILHSVMNSCSGMPGLSPAVVAYITSGRRDSCVEHVVIEDVPDPAYQGKLRKLLECPDEELGKFTNPDSELDLTDLLMSAGFPHIIVTPERRYLAYECCLRYEVITKRIAALDDIRKGLQCVKERGNTALDLLARWPGLKSTFFPEARKEAVNLENMVSRIVYVTDGNAIHNTARDHFYHYMTELGTRDGADDSCQKLSDLLLFWTAQPALPADRSKKLSVQFLDATTKILPEADTCPMVLLLPTVHKTYNEFKTSMDKAVECGKFGFGKM